MGYYNENTLKKFADALQDAKSRLDGLHVKFSASNSKMGNVASVSTLPFITCPGCCATTCGGKCYAAKLANLRPNVLKNYAENTALALYRPVQYWAEINNYCKGVRFFRFHVSGDIINRKYFENMVETAQNNPHCEMLAFTKRFDAVNAYLASGNQIPENLHIMFSGWSNLTPENPHRLPETNVIEKGAEVPQKWTICGGNCFECACASGGCWGAQNGDTIAFHIH